MYLSNKIIADAKKQKDLESFADQKLLVGHDFTYEPDSLPGVLPVPQLGTDRAPWELNKTVISDTQPTGNIQVIDGRIQLTYPQNVYICKSLSATPSRICAKIQFDLKDYSYIGTDHTKVVLVAGNKGSTPINWAWDCVHVRFGLWSGQVVVYIDKINAGVQTLDLVHVSPQKNIPYGEPMLIEIRLDPANNTVHALVNHQELTSFTDPDFGTLIGPDIYVQPYAVTNDISDWPSVHSIFAFK